MAPTCSPFQKLHVLCVLDETSPHHDGLETLSVDGPQLHICKSWKSRETLEMSLKTDITPGNENNITAQQHALQLF